MKNSNKTNAPKSTLHCTNKKANNAQRLLDKMKSPLLSLASNLPQTQTPHSHVSLVKRQISQEIEKLSEGRFSLAKGQKFCNETPDQYTLLKLVCHECQQYSWVTIGQLSAYIDNPQKCCCYCEEPLSLEHIGPTLPDVQRFVEVRSGGKTFFSMSNTILGCDLSDIYAFNCLNPCRGLLYETPFIWFLRDSKPVKSFSGFTSEQTCGCPCCTDRQIQKIAKSKIRHHD